MRSFILLLISVILLAGSIFAPVEEKALGYPINGMPGVPGFGYGARLDPMGYQVKKAVQSAGQLDLDWIALEFDWARQQPRSQKSPDWDTLDDVLALAAKNNLAVMLSIQNPPDWALTRSGPDKLLATSLVEELAQRFPKKIQAIELFPGPNTVQGWGATPNPKAYTALLKSVDAALDKTNADIILVSGGLLPVSAADSSGNKNDLKFLEGLYDAGASRHIPVLGIQLPVISQNPVTPPDEVRQMTLRHYEAIRSVMLENDHQNGLIWVTGFSWDPGTTQSPENQAQWLKQAFLMMRRQLFIGAAFYQDLNPSSRISSTNSLIHTDGSLHLAFEAIGQIIALENSSQSVTFEWTLSQNPLP